jgi:predicted CXXCH cytochrome family protein
MTNYAYSATSHGSTTATLEGLVGNDNAANSGLPYGDLADIQCSSCHNPHEDVVRPFMRVPAGSTVQTLCALCHDSRNNTSGSGTGNGTAGNNDSMHPNNIAYPAPSSTQYDPGLIASSDANWVELFSANGRGTASQGEVSLDNVLGGKLLGADGTSGDFGCPTCQPCHLPHGATGDRGHHRAVRPPPVGEQQRERTERRDAVRSLPHGRLPKRRDGSGSRRE